MDMLAVDGNVYYIKNWGKRQFKSDNSTDRVREYRERKSVEQEETVDVTLPERFSNAPETEQNQNRTESETEQNKANPLRVFFDELTTTWHNYYPDKRQYGYDTVKAKIAARYKDKDKGFREQWAEALRMSCNVKALREDKWFSFEWFVRNNANYLKLLDGTFAFKDGDKRTNASKQAKPIDCDDATEFFKGAG